MPIFAKINRLVMGHAIITPCKVIVLCSATILRHPVQEHDFTKTEIAGFRLQDTGYRLPVKFRHLTTGNWQLFSL
jgi:hypothetical protein